MLACRQVAGIERTYIERPVTYKDRIITHRQDHLFYPVDNGVFMVGIFTAAELVYMHAGNCVYVAAVGIRDRSAMVCRTMA